MREPPERPGRDRIQAPEPFGGLARDPAPRGAQDALRGVELLQVAPQRAVLGHEAAAEDGGERPGADRDSEPDENRQPRAMAQTRTGESERVEEAGQNR